jgi:hypothetical protein
MRYLGGKSKLARKIVARVLDLAPETRGFCEPFMGGGAVTLELAKHRPTLAGDGFRGLLNMYQALRQGLLLFDSERCFCEARALRALGARVFLSEFKSPFRAVAEFTRDITVNRVAGAANSTQKTDRLFEVDP